MSACAKERQGHLIALSQECMQAFGRNLAQCFGVHMLAGVYSAENKLAPCSSLLL